MTGTAVPTVWDIKEHRVRHGDVYDGLDDLMQGERAALTYVDPPWGPGALRMFATMMRKQTGQEPRELDFTAFMERLFLQLAIHTQGYCVVEYSVRWPNLIGELAIAHGFDVLGVATATYGRPARPLHIHVLANHPDSNVDHAKVIRDISETTGGYATTRAAAPLASPGDVLLDPCCGLGFSARLALDTNMRFRGNEINESRLQRTTAVLSRGPKK